MAWLKLKGKLPTKKGYSGKSSGAQKMFLLSVILGFAFVMFGIFDPEPVPSHMPWQLVAGGFMVLAGLAAESSIYMFKGRSPVLAGRNFKASLWSTDPSASASAPMSGRTVTNDIWYLEGFRAWKVYSEGGKRNGIAIIPRYFWHKGGMTVHVAADFEEVSYHMLPPSIQKALDRLENFDKDTSPILWFRIPNNTFRYTIEIHAKEKIMEGIKDIIADRDAANTAYNDIVELLGSYRENFKVDQRYMRKGKRFVSREPREEEYSEQQ